MNEFEFDVEKVTRLEIIDSDGRNYVQRNVKEMDFSLQDDGRTLKIFIITKDSNDV